MAGKRKIVLSQKEDQQHTPKKKKNRSQHGVTGANAESIRSRIRQPASGQRREHVSCDALDQRLEFGEIDAVKAIPEEGKFLADHFAQAMVVRPEIRPNLDLPSFNFPPPPPPPPLLEPSAINTASKLHRPIPGLSPSEDTEAKCHANFVTYGSGKENTTKPSEQEMMNVNGSHHSHRHQPPQQPFSKDKRSHGHDAVPFSTVLPGPMQSHIQVAKPYVFQQAIEGCLDDLGVALPREDNIRLAGVQWIDNVRRALKL